jgi:hypothetical protein
MISRRGKHRQIFETEIASVHLYWIGRAIGEVVERVLRSSAAILNHYIREFPSVGEN